MTTAEHIAILMGTVLIARGIVDMFVFFTKRHKEKEEEKERMEFKIERLRDRIIALEKEIYTLKTDNFQKEER